MENTADFDGVLPGGESTPIWFDNVVCDGDETRLEWCNRNNTPEYGEISSCGHGEDIGVGCDAPTWDSMENSSEWLRLVHSKGGW